MAVYMKYVIANWKMYLDLKNSREFFKQIPNSKFQIPKNLELIVCPSFLFLSQILDTEYSIPNIAWGAQDCFWAERGAHTGEVSPADLLELGVKYVIIGHSERRQELGETDEMVNKKLLAAQKAGLKPILCVGETAEEREEGKAEEVVANQLKKDLIGVEAGNLLIAYEPIWAIGTGQSCEPGEAVKMHQLIKSKTHNAPVLYGGSVDDKNVASYVTEEAVDGVLVGGASTKPEVFASLLKNVSNL
jgi:triosephosphate isomerase